MSMDVFQTWLQAEINMFEDKCCLTLQNLVSFRKWFLLRSASASFEFKVFVLRNCYKLLVCSDHHLVLNEKHSDSCFKLVLALIISLR